MNNERTVTVFGGTGFLGRRIARHLQNLAFAVRVASRHSSRNHDVGVGDPHLQSVEADIHDDRSVADAIAGAYGVVNAVSLYVERGRQTFHSVHVEAAERVASQARRAGVVRLAHVSGIGSDPSSPSLYIRKRGEGELAVRGAFADAVIIRPAVMFGPDDTFLTTILAILRRAPVYPMFGRGLTRLQPAYVEDVAEAIARTLQLPELHSTTFELGGPRVYTYNELLRTIVHDAHVRRTLVPVPFAVWHTMARLAEMLPSPPLTRNQVELMKVDTVSSPTMPGFRELDVSPHSVENVLREIIRDR